MHQGTLPREQALRDMVVAKEEGKDYNASDLDAGIKSAVNSLVDQQVRTGIDIVNDGEQSKSGFSYYIRTRLSGHEERTVSIDPNAAPRNTSGRDHADFPGFFQKLRGTPTYTRSQSFLTGPGQVHRPGVGAAGHRQPQGGDGGQGRRGRRADEHRAGHDRALDAQRALRVGGRLPHGHRRRHARGVQGDHRRRPHRANRRPGPGGRLAGLPGDERRRSTTPTPTCASRR